MVFDVILIAFFLASIGILWYRISVKIPELVAIPDQVISERLEEQSARVRLFALQFKSYFKERRYKSFLLHVVWKALYRFHIFIMRLDNLTVALLKKVRTNNAFVIGNGNGNGNGNANGEYWKELQKANSIAVTAASHRVEEVRQKL